jgi:hypothetical protein
MVNILLWILFWLCVLGFVGSLGAEPCDREERGFKCSHDPKRYNCSIALREKGEK